MGEYAAIAAATATRCASTINHARTFTNEATDTWTRLPRLGRCAGSQPAGATRCTLASLAPKPRRHWSSESRRRTHNG